MDRYPWQQPTDAAAVSKVRCDTRRIRAACLSREPKLAGFAPVDGKAAEDGFIALRAEGLKRDGCERREGEVGLEK